MSNEKREIHRRASFSGASGSNYLADTLDSTLKVGGVFAVFFLCMWVGSEVRSTHKVNKYKEHQKQIHRTAYMLGTKRMYDRMLTGEQIKLECIKESYAIDSLTFFE